MLENEKLTDVCMFVMGYGEIFLSGYKYHSVTYRTNHKLGYLKTKDYLELNKYIKYLRENVNVLLTKKNNFPSLETKDEKLLKKARNIFFGSEERMNSAISNIKQKYKIDDETAALKKLIKIYDRR